MRLDGAGRRTQDGWNTTPYTLHPTRLRPLLPVARPACVGEASQGRCSAVLDKNGFLRLRGRFELVQIAGRSVYLAKLWDPWW